MKSKVSLMAAIVGLAMLATPIAAAAKDHRYDYVRAQGPRSTWAAPVPALRPVHEWHDRGWHDGDGYRGYGRRGYYPAPVYTAPVYAAPAPAYGYGPGYGYSNPCRRANSVMYNYQKDRATGHPAAAYDLLRQNQWALHNGCTAGPASYRGGYGNYGYGGYGQPYGGNSTFSPLLQYFR